MLTLLDALLMLSLSRSTVSLRMQINPDNEFKDRTEQRAFADYLFCNLILFLVVFNFMG